MLKLILFILSFSAFAEESLVAGCRIIRKNGEIVMGVPGRRCAFLDDGTIISGGAGKLRHFSSKGEILWEIPMRETAVFHLTPDHKILVLSESEGDLPGDPRKYVLEILDLNGAMIKKTDSHLLFGREKQLLLTDFRPAGKSGYLISSYGDGVYFLNEDLRLKGSRIRLAGNHEVREVQLADEKNLIYIVSPSTKKFIPDPKIYVEEYNFSRKKVVSRYPKVPIASFYFPVGGSLSVKGERFVLAHPFSGSYIVSRKNWKLENYVTETHLDINIARVPETVELKDLERFFEGWKF